jgi:hypothetical protein
MLDRALVPVATPAPDADEDAWPAQAGWYFDPSVSARRWWDGEEWTDLVETRVPISAAGRHSGEAGRHGVGVRLGSPFGRHGELPEPQLVTGRRVLVAVGAAAAAALVFGVVVPALRTSPQPEAAPGGVSSPAVSSSPARPGATPTRPASSTPATKPAASSPSPTLQGGTGGTSSDASLLVDTSGSGNSTLPEFATLGDWQLQYTFDCGAVGGSHPFRISSPAGSVVAVTGTSGADAVNRTEHGINKLTVTTPCAWSVQVFGPAVHP